MDGQFRLAAERAVIHLARVGVVLAVFIADLALFDHAVEQQGFQLLDDIGGLDLSALDLFLDVLLFVGQILVKLTITLDIGLLLQQIERHLQLFALHGYVLTKALPHQHAEVAQRSFVLLDVLDQKQCLEHTHCIRVT
ncbi:hypothetical protein D3C84_801010 [compost metagenome]